MGVDICKNVRVGCLAENKESWSNNRTQAASVTVTHAIRRSLFGPVDHDETASFFEKEFALVAEQQKNKYNFDFANDRPLKGTFVWEKVENQTCAPGPFVSAATTTVSSCKTRSPKKMSNQRVTKQSRGKRSPQKNKILVCRDNVDRKSTQTSITDFLEKSKNLKRPTNK